MPSDWYVLWGGRYYGAKEYTVMHSCLVQGQGRLSQLHWEFSTGDTDLLLAFKTSRVLTNNQRLKLSHPIPEQSPRIRNHCTTQDFAEIRWLWQLLLTVWCQCLLWVLVLMTTRKIPSVREGDELALSEDIGHEGITGRKDREQINENYVVRAAAIEYVWLVKSTSSRWLYYPDHDIYECSRDLSSAAKGYHQ